MLLNLVTIAGTDSDANTNKNFGMTAKYPTLFYDHLSDVNASKKEGYLTKTLFWSSDENQCQGILQLSPNFTYTLQQVFSELFIK